MIMRCKYCGSSVEENDAFCQVCGRSLTADPAPAQGESDIQPEPPVVQSGNFANEIEQAVKNSKNSLAVTSLIFGILSIFCCSIITAPAGIVLSCFGLGSNRKGIAIAGMILNIAAVLIGVIYTIICFAMMMEYGYYGDILGGLGA